MLNVIPEEIINKDIICNKQDTIIETSKHTNKSDSIIPVNLPNQLCSKIKGNLSSTSNNIIDKILYIENVLSNRSSIKELTSFRETKEEVEKSLSNLNISSLSQDFNLSFNLTPKRSNNDECSPRKIEECMQKVILVLVIFAFCSFLHLVMCMLFSIN